MSYWTKLSLILGQLWRAHPTKSGHFAPAYLGGSKKLRAYIFLYLWLEGINIKESWYYYSCSKIWNVLSKPFILVVKLIWFHWFEYEILFIKHQFTVSWFFVLSKLYFPVQLYNNFNTQWNVHGCLGDELRHWRSNQPAPRYVKSTFK